MGRKSLLASTTKKKATGKKKTASKKAVKAVAAQMTKKNEEAKVEAKATTPEKTVANTATPAKKKAAKAKARVTKAPTVKKKTPAAKKKKVTLKNLLFKEFVLGKAIVKPMKVEKKAVKIPEAPAFVSGYGKKETEQIRGLLFRQFDLKASMGKKEGPAKKAPAKKAPAAKEKRVTLKDLLFKQFVLGKAVVKPMKVEKKAVKIPEAPAFVSGYGKKETEQIRSLLFRQFDLTAVKPAKKAAAKADAPAKKAPAAQKKAVILKDLIFKEFKVGTPVARITIDKIVAKIPEAPPFISGYDQKEMEKIRALLFKAFDLKPKAPGKKAEEAVAEPAPAAVSPQVTAFEPAPSAEPAGTDHMGKAVRMGLCALALLIAIIVGTSFSNRGKFYLKEVDNGVEIWRGKFAPVGTELVYKLDGITIPDPLRESYSQKEISPLLFGYFLNKADAVLDVPAGPDIPKMKDYLRQAADFAPSVVLKGQIQRRLQGIDFVIAFHKADVALSKGTVSDLRVAKSSLARAYSSATTDSQRELVVKTQVAVDEALAALKMK